MAEGWLYDGRSALRRTVEVRTAAEALLLSLGDTGEQVEVPVADLVHSDSRRETEIYGHMSIAGWQLGLATPLPDELAALLPARRVYGRWIDRVGLMPALLIGAILSASILLVGQFFPAWVAPFVPRSWERNFGDALVGDFGQRFCTGPGGQQALDKLTARLTPDAERLRVRVVNVPMVNAAALPGGNLVIFDRLLKQAEGPDELAGVLAHEIAHDENRHVTQNMIREFGLSLLLASVGGTTGGNVEALMSARYSRTAEEQADEDAIESLDRAGISPGPTAAFFERMARAERELRFVSEPLSYLSSHPLSDNRQRKFEAAVRPHKTYEPSLTPAEWNALVHICDGQKPLLQRPI